MAFMLLGIYLAVFAHNAIPHHHHTQFVDELVHTLLQDDDHHHHEPDHHQHEGSDHHQREYGNHCHESHKHEYHQYETVLSDVKTTFDSFDVFGGFAEGGAICREKEVFLCVEYLIQLIAWDKSVQTLRGPPIVA